MMPEMDGWETFKYIRQVMDLPIIILSALAVKEDIVKALELGVDDYITKPFFNDEVVARVRNVLRRIQGANQEDVLFISDLNMFLDLTLQVIRVGEKTIQLTSREYDLFYLLVKKSPKVVKYEEITKSIWGEDTDDARNRLKFLVYLLRKKLETVIEGQDIILNLDRIGYKISI
jgi:DNA-binding response OmpR family regulator